MPLKVPINQRWPDLLDQVHFQNQIITTTKNALYLYLQQYHDLPQTKQHCLLCENRIFLNMLFPNMNFQDFLAR